MTLKTTRQLLIVCLISIFSGCASTPIIVNYYTLNSIETINKPNRPIVAREQTPTVLVSPVKLADFLATGALVMQLKSHQIQLSNQHRWADNLSDAITRSLLANLTKTVSDYHFEKNELHWKDNAQASIHINLEQFTVLADHTVLTSGSFWLLNKHNKLMTKHSFEIVKSLTKDGYNHAVAQLESSLIILAQKIESSFKSLK